MKHILSLCALIATTLVANGQTILIDEWDMSGQGQWQSSNNGVNLGGHFNTNNQQFAQTPGDGLFIFAPLNATDNGNKLNLNSTIDLTEGVARISATYDSFDWESNPDAQNQVGFRLYDETGTYYIELTFQDNSGKVWAYAKGSTELMPDGALKTGRLTKGLAESGSPRTVTLELDYADGEIRVYCPEEWDYTPSGDKAEVFTQAVDFAAVGMTTVGRLQTRYKDWGTGDFTVFDHLRVDTVRPATEVYVDSFQTFTTKANEVSTNAFSFSVDAGDALVVLAASNKSDDPTIDSLRVSGDATFTREYDRRNNGPSASYWVISALTAGDIDLEYHALNNLGQVGVYHILAPEDEMVSVLASAKNAGDQSLTITNSYGLNAADSGLILETVSAYGGAATAVTPEIEVDAGEGKNRVIAQRAFGGVGSLQHEWTIPVVDKVSIIGVALTSTPYVAPPETPTEYFAVWLSEYDLGELDGLTDDADGDGLSNLMEYALGTDPTSGAGRLGTLTYGGEPGSEYIDFVHQRRTDAETRGLGYQVLTSGDLVNAAWSDAHHTILGVGPSEQEGFESVTNRVDATDGSRFVELEVSFE